MEIKFRSDDLVTVSQAAQGIGCARLSIYRWLRSGKIIGVEMAGLLFIPKTEVERLTKERTVGDKIKENYASH